MTENIVLHPDLAQKISAAITSRSVARDMVGVALNAKPFDNETFLYWVDAHDEASNKLIVMGIDVVKYDGDLIRKVKP